MNGEELHAIDPDLVPASGELTTLTSFLDYYRAVMVRKAQGLTQDQMATRLGPSVLTIGGLLKHLAVVEDAWFTKRLLGQDDIEPWASVDWEAEPDWDFASAAADDPGDLVRLPGGVRAEAASPSPMSPISMPYRSWPTARPALHDALDPRAHDRGDRPARRPRRPHSREHRRRRRRLSRPAHRRTGSESQPSRGGINTRLKGADGVEGEAISSRSVRRP